MKSRKAVAASFAAMLLCSAFFFSGGAAQAQDWPKHEIPVLDGLTWSGFVDTYFAHDFNDIETDTRPYTTQASRDDRARLNLAFIDAKLDQEEWRGRVAMQIGDSVTSNYSAEKHEFWQYVQEAVVGYKLTEDLWLDAGVYLAHIGLESFNSRDNWNYTRSLVAEFSPYYETGGKLSYQINDEWSAQLHLLRGWQNISSSSDVGYGMQVAWTPNEIWQFTYNNFLGDVNGSRVFNELLAKAKLTDDWSVAAQLDYGTQDRPGQTDVYWHGWTLISQYKVHPKVALGGRVERYVDPHQVLIVTPSGASFNSVGLSANIDIEVLPALFWRNEYRVLLARNDVFPKNGGFSDDDSLVVTSLSYSF